MPMFPSTFRLAIALSLASLVSTSSLSQSAVTPFVLHGVVTRSVSGAQTRGADGSTRPVEDAMVNLCTMRFGGPICDSLVSTVSDANGTFEIVLDALLPNEEYAIRARGAGDTWSTQRLGIGSNSAQWQKPISISVGDRGNTAAEPTIDASGTFPVRLADTSEEQANLRRRIEDLQSADETAEERRAALEQALVDVGKLPQVNADTQGKAQELQQEHQQRQQEHQQRQANISEAKERLAFLQTKPESTVALEPPVPISDEKAAFGTRIVVFATDRAVNKAAAAIKITNIHNATGALTLGLCEVAVDRQGGLINNFLHLIYDRDSDRFYSVRNISLPDKTVIWQTVKTALAINTAHDALLFIPGFKTSFEDGCRRAAQIGYDLNFTGPIFLYSWPSHNAVLDYGGDEEMAEWSGPHFTGFLKDLLTQHGINHLHIVAHSMGNRILARTLFTQNLTPAEQSHLGQIVFAAPDINRLIFDQYTIDNVKPLRITLYASNHDQALALSEALHRASRLGDALPDLDLRPGMDSIDASAVDTSLLGHSYIAASRSVLTDLAWLISYNTDPGKRAAVIQKGQPPKLWWQLNP